MKAYYKIKIQHKPLWLVFFSSAAILLIVYNFYWTDLLKRLMEWVFVGTGFTLLVDYGLIDFLNSKQKREGDMNKEIQKL
jgi:hypothetical protein